MSAIECTCCGAPASINEPCRYCGTVALKRRPSSGGAKIEIRNVTLGGSLDPDTIREMIESVIAPGKPVFG